MCRVMKTGSTSFRESFARMPGVDLVADKAFGRHFSMAEIREAVGEETYSTYFKCEDKLTFSNIHQQKIGPLFKGPIFINHLRILQGTFLLVFV